MNWFSLDAHGKKFLVIDIASGSVGATVVRMARDARPTILFTAREAVAPAEELTPEHFFSATLHSLKALCAQVFRLYRGEMAGVEQAHIFLRAPWIVSKTRSVRAEFPEPSVVTEAVLASVIREAEKGIAENFHAAHREIASDVRVVEKKITEFRVNGYAVASALGKEARTLELTLLESFAPENAILKFNTLFDSLTAAPREYHAGAAAAHGALSASTEERGDSLTVCVGSEATELCIERNGILQEVVSVPVGVRTAARGVVGEGVFNSVISAESFLRAESVQKLSDARRVSVEAAREGSAVRLRRTAANALAPKMKNGFSPTRAVVLCDEKDISLCERVFRAPLEFAVHAAEAFSNSVAYLRSAIPDTFLSAEAAFVALYEEGKKL
ncbi:MAG: hypothetical protein UX81_C0005G0044 [Parcubacteria group bacterium GW2011_GWA2_47_12]|nr:MAG: hypothetical protein UX81_C0005G0044 [Parcubacteria group bacterium GW2011_GWA2_47_12]